jgi:hypothetical protein
MSERPLPKSWPQRLRERLADAAKAHPPQLKVVPKGRRSGPYIGERWHSPAGQAEMNAEAEGLLSTKPCVDCGKKVIASTGELIGNPGWCGPCWGARQLDEPPTAA